MQRAMYASLAARLLCSRAPRTGASAPKVASLTLLCALAVTGATACGGRPGGSFIPDIVESEGGGGGDGGTMFDGTPLDEPIFVPDVRPVERDVVVDVQQSEAGNGCLTQELCGNGGDDDCDGMVDEGCPCAPGDMQRCFNGPVNARAVGACTDGRQVCRGAGSEFGEWGPCEGAVLPVAETCDSALADEDCDGTRNEDCECAEGAMPVPCGSTVGACRQGTQTCEMGHLGMCTGATGPAMETCDNIDNDCDGMVDEGLTRPCGTMVGACRMGTQTCAAGMWGACSGGVDPSMELCDGVDNNCNGSVDEGLSRSCGSMVGACRQGTQLCGAGGMWGMCVGSTGPVAELCDGVDNDCDGIMDEGCACRMGQTRPCGITMGQCRAGVETCSIMGVYGACTGAVGPSEELCDGVDNDCDGNTDEGLVRVCGSSVGVCRTGFQMCAMGTYGACTGGVMPGPAEVCEGTLDENCNGAVDEGCGCTRGQMRACGSMVGACRAGTQTCDGAGQWSVCMGATGPGTETCDGVDNDCDGMTDEGCGCIGGQTRACGSMVGACRAGTETCSATGVWGACTGATGPSAELCDTIDNDCDGMTDEGCGCVQGQTRACGSMVGICRQGTETCGATGSWGPCTGGTTAGTEVCNMMDDDCDGMTDEGGVCPARAPVVTCPAAMSTAVGSAVTLNATAVDPDGPTPAPTLTWSVPAPLTGSSATPAPANATSTMFTPDVPGTHLLRFCARDAVNTSLQACCTTDVTAMAACSMPPAPVVSTTCGRSWDGRPIIEFNPPVPAGLTYQVFRTGNATPLGTAVAGNNYFRPPTRIDAGGPLPGVGVSLYVRACRASDPTCCVNSNEVFTNIVEECTTPIPAAPDNIVISEYIINGDGVPCPGVRCEAGESVEITNLSNCPVTLAGDHFAYRSSDDNNAAVRWMNFGADDVIPPRGVYVTIRERDASACDVNMPAESAGLFGLRVSRLTMVSFPMTTPSTDNGWFGNNMMPLKTFRIATGPFFDTATPRNPANFTSGTQLARIDGYRVWTGTNTECRSTAFDAVDSCAEVVAGAVPMTNLMTNQLGRLWHPCDAVVSPNPAMCR